VALWIYLICGQTNGDGQFKGVDMTKVLVARGGWWSEASLEDGWGEVNGHEKELADLVVKLFREECDRAFPMDIIWTPRTGEVWAEQHEILNADWFKSELDRVYLFTMGDVWSAVIGDESLVQQLVDDILKGV